MVLLWLAMKNLHGFKFMVCIFVVVMRVLIAQYRCTAVTW